ncbi:MAG: cytochrome c oxidase subunit 3 [Acidobacteria bacterium]|nr:cytochrome c oxidase subunit 3 [Acidobacteriota bacterium]
MWLFIVSDALTFSALLIAYSYSRVASADWPLPFHFWPSIVVASVMTFCLLSSSVTMVMAVAAAKQGRVGATVNWLLATMLGGVAFIILHANEWRTLIGEGLRPFDNPWGSPLFGATFFTCTGLHMLHVTIGVIVLGVMAIGFKKGRYPADYVEISGLYWHFVDLVWMFIFPLIYLMSVPLEH